jgi:hypothetical protein
MVRTTESSVTTATEIQDALERASISACLRQRLPNILGALFTCFEETAEMWVAVDSELRVWNAHKRARRD